MPFTDIQFLTRLVTLLSGYLANPDTSPTGKLFITAVGCLGTDASPNDVAPDEFGCAETIDTIHKKAFGTWIAPGSGPTLSTNVLYQTFLKNKMSWQQTKDPVPGAIVISPTGYGTNPSMPNGHVGIVSKDGRIMSNTSATGLFMENYTLDTWKARYVTLGGYPMLFFRRL